MSMSYPSRRSLTPTVRQVLRDHAKFRILVVGRRGSGKSSLIKSVFKAAPAKVPGKADINVEFHPEDNRYLIVHESSGLEPGDAQGLETIRNFISYRTDPSRSAPERLHAVWICVPASDAIDGSIGEWVQKLLGVGRGTMPIIVTFTKFDSVVSKFVTDFEGGNLQHYESARTTAYTRCEQSCHSVFGRELKDVPAEIVSVDSRFHDLIDKLVVTTDKFITGRLTVPTSSVRSRAQMAKPRVAPVPLAWSAALRVCRILSSKPLSKLDGVARYWRNLWSSLEFSNQCLKNYVKTIHLDIVEIWNLNERARYLSSTEVMGKMSHVVKDLATSDGSGPLSPVPTESGDKFAEWVDDMYRGSPENVRCVMGYIVDLTVILDGIFRTTEGSVVLRDALLAVDRHLRSSRRDNIHQDIRNFVKETFSI
ncbi:hypothetical protein BC826DRAFT_1179001 [Russula brevipes]|nr:hypothetical protein BC826DRAFT_1179001 [Russula brevipes]